MILIPLLKRWYKWYLRTDSEHQKSLKNVLKNTPEKSNNSHYGSSSSRPFNHIEDNYTSASSFSTGITTTSIV